MNIEKVDKNFLVKAETGENTVYYDVLQEPFAVYGLLHDEKGFCRMPQEVADRISLGVAGLNRHTAGGRVRFVTDSSTVSIRVSLYGAAKMPHFALTGSIGLDLYADGRYVGTFVPPFDVETGFSSSLQIAGERKMRDVCIHLPLYSGVTRLEIGLESDSKIEKSSPYRFEAPAVFYGSSITQGGCASRPGNACQNIITRKYGIDHVNLGFSGSARGEREMAEYIASLPMSAFVLDYDHNAPTAEHLENTHEKMFRTIRAAQPDLPILILSRPKVYLNGEEEKRRSVIMKTYRNALDAGDKNVRFVDGKTVFTTFGGDSCTVDGDHPNDLGFMCMAESIGAALNEILGNKKDGSKRS